MNTTITIGTKKFTFRLEIIILIIIVLWILWGHLLCSCSKMTWGDGYSIIDTFINKGKEGFSSNNIAYSQQYSNFKHPQKINTKAWSMPTLTYSSNKKPSSQVEKIWNRKKQPIPLRKGELDMFATTPFKPECCPNTYSNSMGCACMTVDQYDYLRKRAGNNVPYSEY